MEQRPDASDWPVVVLDVGADTENGEPPRPDGTAVAAVAVSDGRPLGATIVPAAADPGPWLRRHFAAELQRRRVLANLGGTRPLPSDPSSLAVLVEPAPDGSTAGRTLRSVQLLDPAPGRVEAAPAGERAPVAALTSAGIVAVVPAGWELHPRWGAAIAAAFDDPLVMVAAGAELARSCGVRGLEALGAELEPRCADGTRARPAAARRWEGRRPLALRADLCDRLLRLTGSVSAVRATAGRTVLRAGYRCVTEPAALAWRPLGTGGATARPARVRALTASLRPPRVPAGTSAAAAPSPADTRPATHGETASAGVGDTPPTLSVVIPTRGRRELVLRLLSALQLQNYPRDRLQVVVCVDGDVDGTASAVAAAGLRLAPEVLVLPPRADGAGRGPGAARNAGAAGAEGELLVFLDDDVLPTGPGLLAAHARAHAAVTGDAVVVGPAVPRLGGAWGLHEQRLRNWWLRYADRLGRGEDLVFGDACTANLSLPSSVFRRAGGFAELARREDWELGYRLSRAGTALVASAAASTSHDADLRLRHGIGARVAEGAGDVAFARAHPEAVDWLPLGSAADAGAAARALAAVAVARPSAVVRLLRPAGAVAVAGNRIGARPGAARLLDAVLRMAYWTGAATAAGGAADLRALLDAGRASAGAPVDCDVTSPGWRPPEPWACGRVRVRWGSVHLGEAPLGWGGMPWSRRTFAERVARRYGSPGPGYTQR